MRNKPCPCGSGRKYKKCCLDKDSKPKSFNIYKVRPDSLPKPLQVHGKEQEILVNMGIHINYVKPVIFQGKKVWAIGNRIYHSRPPNQTFHEFIIEVLQLTLGREWWDNQRNLAPEERHFIMKCFLKFYEWQRRSSSLADNKISDHLWGARPDGWSKSLIALAFDVCSLQHKLSLPEHLLNRLRNRNEYQGARYEIGIAAIFARLGCDIEFLEEEKKLKIKHYEFIATHRETNVSVAVEAKSRHRPGILHTEGVVEEEQLLKGDVHRLLNRALKQNPNDRPFMIFIDINSPLTPGVRPEEKQWFKDIKKFMDSYDSPSMENPDPYNAIFFTNYSYHYQTEREADPGEYLCIIPRHSKFPLPSPDFLSMLTRALNHYGSVPDLDTELRA